MAKLLRFSEDWYNALAKYSKISDQQMAYILFAAMKYAFYEEPIDIGEVFGKEFSGLNMAMPTIYDQIDRLNGYSKNSKNGKIYDDDAIYELRMQKKTGPQICQILGYPPEKVRSLSTTEGWIRAKKEMEALKNTEICQTSAPKEKNTEICQKVQNSVKNLNTENRQNPAFEF